MYPLWSLLYWLLIRGEQIFMNLLWFDRTSSRTWGAVLFRARLFWWSCGPDLRLSSITCGSRTSKSRLPCISLSWNHRLTFRDRRRRIAAIFLVLARRTFVMMSLKMNGFSYPCPARLSRLGFASVSSWLDWRSSARPDWCRRPLGTLFPFLWFQKVVWGGVVF